MVETSSMENIIKNGKVESLHTINLEDEVKECPKTERNCTNYKRLLINLAIFLILTGYFIWATYYFIRNTEYIDIQVFNATTCDGYGFLVILYGFYLYGILYSYVLKPHLLPVIKKAVWTPSKLFLNNIKYGSYIFYTSFLVATMAYLIVDTSENRDRLIPLLGLALFVLVGYIFSANRSKIQWDTVIWGIIMQFIFGLLTIRWETGRNILECFADKVTIFLGYAFKGASFTYGSILVDEYQIFAFKALATVFFTGFIVNVLYYYGIMQNVVSTIGEFFHWIMRTSICESVSSAANIFLGMTESPLLIKPYLKDLTDSELNSIMTSGFATVSGSTLAAYIIYGARAQDLITASVMSAPAALCFSKLMYPETETVRVNKDQIGIIKMEFDSVLGAAAKGATDAFIIVSNIISGVLAFLAFVYFINGLLGWFGELVGFSGSEEWSLDLIVGKIFIPVSWVMGVPWDECEKVGQLIGLKTMVNEFVAFEKLGTMDLTDKTKAIATYAICGFSNPGSIGIVLSSMSSLIPERREAINRLILRAFVAGALVCFMTACIAGVLITDDAVASSSSNSTLLV